MRNPISSGVLALVVIVPWLSAQVADALSSVTKAVQAGSGAYSPADGPSLRVDPNTLGSAYAGVGSLTIQSSGGTLTGTAVAISPWWVLTAGHNLDTNDDGQVDAGIQISFSLNYGSDLSQTYSATQFVLNPGFTGFMNPTVNGDLGLLRLSSALPATLPIYSLWTGSVSVGQQFTVVGYGQSGSGDSGYTTSASTTVKRVGGNVIDSFTQLSGHNEVFIYDFDSPSTYGTTGGSLGNAWETLIGPGDSGGPMFITGGSTLYVAGINTFTMGGNYGRFGDQGGGILLGSYAEWIQTTTAVPEPQAAVVLGAAALLGAIVFRSSRRPRKRR